MAGCTTLSCGQFASFENQVAIKYPSPDHSRQPARDKTTRPELCINMHRQIDKLGNDNTHKAGQSPGKNQKNKKLHVESYDKLTMLNIWADCKFDMMPELPWCETLRSAKIITARILWLLLVCVSCNSKASMSYQELFQKQQACTLCRLQLLVSWNTLKQTSVFILF